MTLRILYIAALPRDQHSLPVEQEFKTIEDERKKSDYRDQIALESRFGISLEDFQSVIRTSKPNVLHFSGHATEEGDLVFQGPEEESQKVSKDPFTTAFKLLGQSLRLVVLSACYSEKQAVQIAEHVDRIIGTRKEIGSDQAVKFAKEFYESLFDSKSIEDAFKEAKNQLSLNKKEGESIPDLILLKNQSRDLSPLVLVNESVELLNKLKNELYKDFGLNWLPVDYFRSHKSTKKDYEDWKNGFSFNLESIYEKKELRRSIVDTIKTNLEKNHRLLLLGELGSSKSTILMEVMCEYFNSGYQILYDLGNSELRNDESLISIIEDLANANNKVLIAVNNVHDKKSSAVFSLMDKLETFEKKESIHFILAGRIPEYSCLVDQIEEKHKDPFKKFRADRTLEFKVPAFTSEDIKQFIKNYTNVKSSEGEEEIEEILNKKSIDIYKSTKGNPIIVKFAVFTEGLRKDVDDRYDKYMRDPISRLPDSLKIQTAIVCSLLDITGITITDTLLESMNLKEHARPLKGALLYHQDGVWKTIHPRWDLEFLSYLYGEELDEDELEEKLEKNRPYLEDALKSIFLIKDGKISVSVIQVLFDATTVIADNFQKIPIDFIEKVVQIPEYVDSHTQSVLYSSTIASNYFKLKQYPKALEKCQRAIELDSENANAWHNKGVVLYHLETYEEAISSLDKAVALDSSDTYSWHNLANVYGSQGNVYYSQGNHDKAAEYHDKAVKFYNKAIELDPKHAAAWLKKGISLSMLGKYESSIECYDKAIELDSTDIKLVSLGQLGKSVSLGQLGMDSEAMESYNKAIELDPSVETESSQ